MTWLAILVIVIGAIIGLIVLWAWANGDWEDFD